MTWPMVKLGEILCHIGSGATPKGGSKHYHEREEVMFLRSQNVLMNKLMLDDVVYVDKGIDEQLKRSRVYSGDVLLNITGASIGRVVTFDLDAQANVNQHVCILRPITSSLFGKYLEYFLSGVGFQRDLLSLHKGGTREALTFAQIREIEIPLPSLEEQKRIAAILDKADAIRRKRQQAIKLADEFLRSVFLDMFGDPVTNPKGWEVKTIEEVSLKVTDGVHAKPNYTDAGVPFISVKNIINGRISFDDTKFISLVDHLKYSKRCNVENRDIIYTKVGATYGRAALVETVAEFSLYVSVALIKPNHDLIDARFLTEVMNSSSVKRQADRSIKGAGVPDLHLVEIKSFLIPVPDLNTQRGFVLKVNGIYKKVERYKKSLLKFDELFNSLSQKAFSGEL